MNQCLLILFEQYLHGVAARGVHFIHRPGPVLQDTGFLLLRVCTFCNWFFCACLCNLTSIALNIRSHMSLCYYRNLGKKEHTSVRPCSLSSFCLSSWWDPLYLVELIFIFNLPACLSLIVQLYVAPVPELLMVVRFFIAKIN